MSVLSKKYRAREETGFTLIEALIAFVILSVGLLGIVSLQALSKQSQHQAVQRARAISMADSIVERIRINPGGLATYNIGLTPLGGGTVSSEPAPNCRTAICTPTQLATHDLWEWEQALDGAMVKAGTINTSGLIEPKGCIVFDPAPSRLRTGLVNIIIQWQGLNESTDAVQAGEVRCGGAVAGNNDFRRQVSINTFVIDEQEL
ncbi:MAG: type IV pilus assembly protein PilV [Halioglobus sp.]